MSLFQWAGLSQGTWGLCPGAWRGANVFVDQLDILPWAPRHPVLSGFLSASLVFPSAALGRGDPGSSPTSLALPPPAPQYTPQPLSAALTQLLDPSFLQLSPASPGQACSPLKSAWPVLLDSPNPQDPPPTVLFCPPPLPRTSQAGFLHGSYWALLLLTQPPLPSTLHRSLGSCLTHTTRCHAFKRLPPPVGPRQTS